MVAQNVADILAQKTFDALAEFLHAVNILLLHPPSAVGGVGRAWFEFFYFRFDAKVPRNIGREIADARKCAHRLDRDGFVGVQRVHARHAHELWHAVDFGGAGAALAGLAIPAAREVVRLRRLDFVDDIEHHETFGDFRGVIHQFAAAVRVGAPDSESDGLVHFNFNFVAVDVNRLIF
jgi:hypothetical protein